MFKNDRMMMILTGLVLAIFAGSMVKYGDRIMGLMAGEDVVVSQDDSFSVRAGSTQILDVLSNDVASGPIVVLTRPRCGNVELASGNKLSFGSDSLCSGEVQFAYCVDVEGKCEPNAVRINVISVNIIDRGTPVAQAPTPQPESSTEVAAATPAPALPVETTAQQAEELDAANTDEEEWAIASADDIPEPAPAPRDQAPEFESFTVEMAPPSLASPSISELVSPGVAVASIRRQATVLNSDASIDQNISTQNSAARAETSGAAPDVFQSVGFGESSNISLGGGDHNVASAGPAPVGLPSASNAGANIVQLERGPEALASLPNTQSSPALQETAPLSSNPEVNNFSPVEVAAAQTESPTLENSFSATPIDGGPIALVALQPGNNDAAGESLNLLLSEPGEQSLAASLAQPSALAPASDGPTEVSILEREPNASLTANTIAAPDSEQSIDMAIAPFVDRNIDRSPMPSQSAGAHNQAQEQLDVVNQAALPVQVTTASNIAAVDAAAQTAAISPMVDPLSRADDLASLTAPGSLDNSKPGINLTPANSPPEFLQANLPFTPGAQVITAPAQQQFCKINLEGAAVSGANIQLQIDSACKAGQVATINHAGLAFSVEVNAQGETTVTFPAMESEAEVSVSFEDQSSASLTVSVPEIESFVRAGVSWQSGVNLDLNAIEFGAAMGTEGYITPASPRDYRTSRIKGGGYLEQLGDPTLPNGSLTEVYSLPVARNQQRGTIELAILLDNAERYCGQAISAKTSRTREGQEAIVRNVRFNVPLCGTAVGQVVLPGAIDDIRIAGR